MILGGFGIIGYLVYGDSTKQIATQMLPQGHLVFIVQILLCLAILFTYPLQLYPITEVIESYIFKDEHVKNKVLDVEGQGDVNQETSVNGPVKSSEMLDSAYENGSVAIVVGCVNDIDETTELLSATENKMLKPKKKVGNIYFLHLCRLYETISLVIILHPVGRYGYVDLSRISRKFDSMNRHVNSSTNYSYISLVTLRNFEVRSHTVMHTF
jgi:amino acid permease